VLFLSLTVSARHRPPRATPRVSRNGAALTRRARAEPAATAALVRVEDGGSRRRDVVAPGPRAAMDREQGREHPRLLIRITGAPPLDALRRAHERQGHIVARRRRDRVDLHAQLL